MGSFLGKMKGLTPTQVIAVDVNLGEVIDQDFLKEVSKKLADEGEIIVSAIHFQIIPKPPKLKKKPSGKGVGDKITGRWSTI